MRERGREKQTDRGGEGEGRRERREESEGNERPMFIIFSPIVFVGLGTPGWQSAVGYPFDVFSFLFGTQNSPPGATDS